MTRIHRRPVAAATALLLVAGALTGLSRARATETFTFARLAGPDRYGTAAAIATTTFTTADTVVVARGDNFPDALAASFLAGQFTGPVLLTLPNDVPQATLDALGALKTKNVVLLGSTQAISDAVATKLAGRPSTSDAGGNLVVTRIGGRDRFDTARLVATRTGNAFGTLGGQRAAIVTTGLNFADALAAGPLAYAGRLPILLTTPGALPEATTSALGAIGARRVLLLGGPQAVSSVVEAQIRQLNGGTEVTRVAGLDRTATATAIADFALANLGFVDDHVDLALGPGFADALAGGPHGGAAKAPLLLSESSERAGTATTAWLAAHRQRLQSGHVFGGPSALNQSAVNEAARAAGAATNQLIDLTPAGLSVQAASGNGRSAGQRTCTALVPAGTGAVDIALFAPAAVGVDPFERVTFADADADGRADLTVDRTGGVIVSVNGTSTGSSPTNYVNNATPAANGSLNFVIDAAAPDEVWAVVFADTNGDNALNLGADNRPTEVFGIGCRTTWRQPTPPPGPFQATVVSVDKPFNLFVASSPFGTFAFPYGGADQFSTSSGRISQAEFTTRVSPFDTVSGTFAPDPRAPSFYSLTDSAPQAPRNVTSTANDTKVTLTWQASPTPGIDAYRVYRCTGATCTDYSLVKDLPPTTLSYVDSGLAYGTTYNWLVRAVDEGDESVNSDIRQHTISPTPPTILQATATHDEGRDGKLGAGDVHRFVFSEPMAASTAAPGAQYQVADAGGSTETIRCGASGTTCALNSEPVVISSVTYEARRVLTVTMGTGLAGIGYPLRLNAVDASWKDDDGNVASLASGDRTIERDTVAPTILDVRATTDANLQNQVDSGDVHVFVFSEPMAAPTTGSYDLRDGDAVTPTTGRVTCGSGGTTCTLNSAPVTVRGTTYEAGRVLTVTVGTASPSGGTTPGLQYPVTITALANLTDVEGNPVDLSGSPDKTIEKAT